MQQKKASKKRENAEPSRKKIATAVHRWTGKGENGKSKEFEKEFGVYLDPYCYVLLPKEGQPKYFTDFHYLMKNLYLECRDLGLSQLEVKQMQEIHDGAMQTIEQVFGLPAKEIKRLEKEKVDLEYQIDALKRQVNGMKKKLSSDSLECRYDKKTAKG
ncbi:hypothetical protein ACFL6I_14465 [candidate division KSB1 bacterium]